MPQQGTVKLDGPNPLAERDIPRLSSTELMIAADEGALVVDVRSTGEFAAGHLPGTINIPTGAPFADRLELLVDSDRRIVILIGDDSCLAPALRGAALAGIDKVIGWAGPEIFEQWIAAGRQLIRMQELEPGQATDSGRVVIDVRDQSEWDLARIPGARHAALGDLLEKVADVPKDQPLVMHCQAGTRGAIAASLLQASGFTDVANLKGGIDAWCETGLPISQHSPES